MKNKKGFIYKIYCKDSEIKDVYIGSSKRPFSKRLIDHRYNCNNFGCPKYNQYKYKFIRDHGGFENWIMEKIQEFNYIDKYDLLVLETETIKNQEKVLNKKLPVKNYT